MSAVAILLMGWRLRKLFDSIQCNSVCCNDTRKTVSCPSAMEALSSFYVILPSSACKDINPENTASVFKIRLVKPLLLKYTYEVALAEIQFPHT